MKHLVFGAVLLLSGCMSVTDTSFYDDNESLLSVEVRYQVDSLVCGKTDPQNLVDSIHKLYLYTESKGSTDIYNLVSKMKTTSKNINKNLPMCTLKQKLIKKQSADISNAIMRRF